MPEPFHLTPALTQVYIDRNRKEHEMTHYDSNISKADLGVNIMVLVGLLGWIAFLLVG